METERQIVYSILNTLNNHSYNNDEDISERLVRSHILAYRADSIRKHYKNGHTVGDEVFQSLPISFKSPNVGYNFKPGYREFTADAPRVIRLDKHFGFKLQSGHFSIPVLSNDYYNSLHNNDGICNDSFAGTYGDKIKLSLVKSGPFISHREIYQSIQASENKGGEFINIDLTLYAILYNPSDDPTYDWENDIFPFPAERSPELKMQILKNEFGIIADLRAKKDEVANARPDNIRYHEENNIRE